ncbi:MAG: hypothetical protein ACOY5B_11915 [Spirochaetota bacterium]
MPAPRASVLSIGLLVLLACSSAGRREEASTLDALLLRAEELRQAGNTDSAAYERLQLGLETLRSRDTKLCTDSAQREKVAAALAQYPTLQCEVRITEPRERFFTATGFASPLRLVAECPANAPFAFEADSKSLALSGDAMRFTKGYLNARIRVSSASPDAAKNVIQLTARYYAQALIERLAETCSLTPAPGISVFPQEYRIQAVPVVAASAYDAYRQNFRRAEWESAAEEGETRSEAALSANGQFTLGGRHRGRRFDLLYGHPNGELPDGIGTSFTTVRVDGTDFRFEQQKLKRSRRSDGALLAETNLPGTGITITQIIQPQNSGERVRIRIAYQIRNTGKRQHKVGIRLLLDTWAGKNDGVPFLLPAGGIEQLVRTERDLSPAESLLWHTFDLAEESSAEAQPALEGFLTGKDLTPPDRLAIVNWPNAVNTVWDYATHEERRITGDSAAAYWWHPAAILPGQTQLIATEVGAHLRPRQPAVFITNAASGDVLIYLWHRNQGTAAERVGYELSAEKGNFVFKTELGEVNIEPGAVYAKASPAQILAEGESTIIIKETVNGSVREYRFPVQNLKRWKQLASSVVAEPGTGLPVSYFDERELELHARLRDSAGSLIGKTQLVRKKIDGGFEYSGTLNLPAGMAHGRYSVEVVR